jgi:hypothetical protein
MNQITPDSSCKIVASIPSGNSDNIVPISCVRALGIEQCRNLIWAGTTKLMWSQSHDVHFDWLIELHEVNLVMGA